MNNFKKKIKFKTGSKNPSVKPQELANGSGENKSLYSTLGYNQCCKKKREKTQPGQLPTTTLAITEGFFEPALNFFFSRTEDGDLRILKRPYVGFDIMVL